MTGPLLDSQAETTDSIRTWARSLAGVTDRSQERPAIARDPATRTGLRARGFGVLDQIKPTLPVLLANLTTVGQIPSPTTRRSSNCWCCCPVHRGSAVIRASEEQPDGSAAERLRAPSTIRPHARSASCRRRSGATRPTPPHRHPGRAVLQTAAGLPDRRSRRPQPPCMGHPGKRAPTVELCDDPKGFQPLQCANTRSGRIRSIRI